MAAIHWTDMRDAFVEVAGELRADQVKEQLACYGQDEDANAWARMLKRELKLEATPELGKQFDRATTRVHSSIVNVNQFTYVTYCQKNKPEERKEFLSYSDAYAFVKKQKDKLGKRARWANSRYPDHRNALQIDSWGLIFID